MQDLTTQPTPAVEARLLPVGFQQGDVPMDAETRLARAIDGHMEAKQFADGDPRKMLLQAQAACALLPPCDFPLQHTFAPGVYARTIVLPQGSYIVGRIHKHAHLNILSKGRVRVFTESGGFEELVGPLTMVSQPGTKRLVFALEEAVWTTVHLNPQDIQDLGTLAKELIVDTYAEYTDFALRGGV